MKAVHLEVVSEVTTAPFNACLHRFIARWGKPTTIWSDHSTNFVGVARELKDIYTHLGNAQRELVINMFCADQSIVWVLLLNMLHTLVGFRKRQWKSWRAWSAISGISLVTSISTSSNLPRYWLKWKHTWIPGHWYLCPKQKMGSRFWHQAISLSDDPWRCCPI